MPLTSRQRQVAEIDYQSCAHIDRQNRCQPDNLRLEHKFGTHHWSTRVNVSIADLHKMAVAEWLHSLNSVC